MNESIITEDQCSSLRDNGYLAVPDLFSAAEVGAVADLLRPLFATFTDLPGSAVLDLGSTKGQIGQDVPEILFPSTLQPELRQTEVFKRSYAMARQLFGRDTWFRFDHSILKPPHCEFETVWHQDRVHKRSRLPENRVNVWIPMAAVTEAEGCMRYLPGSHKNGLLPHEPVPERRGALRTIGVEEARTVATPLPLGGAALHLFETVHSAFPNTSDQPRLAWILQFTRPRTAVPLAGWVHRGLSSARSAGWRRAQAQAEH